MHLIRNLQIHAHPVGIQSGLTHQFGAGTGNTLQMDVSVEFVDGPQVPGHSHQTFHGIIRIPYHTRTEEKPFDIIPAVELHSKVHQFGHGEGRPRDVIGPAVYAVGTVIDAVICQHHLQQGDAPAVLSEAVTDSHSTHSASQIPVLPLAHGPARRARHVILRRIRQYLQFLQGPFIHTAKVSKIH